LLGKPAQASAEAGALACETFATDLTKQQAPSTLVVLGACFLSEALMRDIRFFSQPSIGICVSGNVTPLQTK
jgi:hypothetical protein